MQNDTNLKQKKTAPIICAAIMILLLSVFLGVVLYPLIGESLGEMMALGIFLIYGLLIVAIIIGILLALKQRLAEIEGGEEEDAKKY